MNLRKSSPLLAIVLVLAMAWPAAAADRKAPRISAAAMKDADGDGRADRVVLRYTERVSHAVDSSKFPFTVSGYRILRVKVARSKPRVVVMLKEKATADGTAKPSIRYQRTKQQPVRDGAGNEAANQLFTGTTAFAPASVARPTPTPTPSPSAAASLSPAPSSSVSPSPTAPSAPMDLDGDGSFPPADCAPENAAIHPNAADPPDVPGFADTNCDGIDGNAANAVFVSPIGDDTYPGTRAQPKRTFLAGVTAAAAQGKSVYATFGTYGERLDVANGVGVYGGYGTDWSRSLSLETKLTGSSSGGRTEGALAANVMAPTTVQHLTLAPANAGAAGVSSYGLRGVNSPGLVLDRVVARGGLAAQGTSGGQGVTGVAGAAGAPGGLGDCDGPNAGDGGGVTGLRVGRDGGEGGRGGQEDWAISSSARPGQAGAGPGGGLGGPAGSRGTTGSPGGAGDNGLSGSFRGHGAGGRPGTVVAGQWQGSAGSRGADGTDGSGGGGGGGGGGQTGITVNDGSGNGGGEGGDGGQGGTAGNGGGGGGGSFGLFLVDSSGAVVKNSLLTAANGGAGGPGGAGGLGKPGGIGGAGGNYCILEVGAGGRGGSGGGGAPGGGGGGGGGGPSIGLYRVNSTITSTGNSFAHGTGGPGGNGSNPGTTGQAADQN